MALERLVLVDTSEAADAEAAEARVTDTATVVMAAAVPPLPVLEVVVGVAVVEVGAGAVGGGMEVERGGGGARGPEGAPPGRESISGWKWAISRQKSCRRVGTSGHTLSHCHRKCSVARVQESGRWYSARYGWS